MRRCPGLLPRPSPQKYHDDHTMIGIGVMVALGRRLLAATLADTGLLPAGYYRHLALEALEEEDFAKALVLRLRLLSARHDEQRVAVQELLKLNPPEKLRERGLALLAQENRARELLGEYEKEGLRILGEIKK